MTKIKDVETALAAFEEAAIKHADATEKCEYKKGNKCYGIIKKSVDFLKQQNEILMLSKFLSHPNVGVRIWAATYLLPITEWESINVLEEISKTSGILSFMAETTLSEWRKGNLKV